MIMDSFNHHQLEQAHSNSVYDLQQLDQLRQRGLSNDESALRAAAQQFEALFMNQLMKSMRQANKVFESEDNPLSSRDVEFFQDMHDNQLTSELSNQGSLGLADLMVQQLSPSGTMNHTPASMLPANQVGGAVHMTENSNRTHAEISASMRDSEQDTVPYQAATRTRGEDNVEASNGRSDHLMMSGGEWRPANPMEFLETLAPYAQQAAEKAGIAPESVLAQAALETGWGRHVVAKGDASTNNLFNIKADSRWQGEQAQTLTTEYYDGKPQRENALFRAYSNVAESFSDYVEFLQGNPRYQQALQVGRDGHQFVEALQQAGYATDPSYARKLQTIMQSDAMQSVREKFGF